MCVSPLTSHPESIALGKTRHNLTLTLIKAQRCLDSGANVLLIPFLIDTHGGCRGLRYLLLNACRDAFVIVKINKAPCNSFVDVLQTVL